MHEPVLKEEILKVFDTSAIHIFIDGTLGAAGHAASILQSHPEITRYIGIDQDPEALEIAKNHLTPWKDKVEFHYGNFADIIPKLLAKGLNNVDGILLDLGVSSMQLDRPEKGFSFMRDGPLDMRMDPNTPLSAADIVNEMDERELGRIFREYGEEKFWKIAAKAIVEARKSKRIETTMQLSDILLAALPWSKQKIHPLTRIFQGLRICVNRELEVVETVLPRAIELLGSGGRFCVISFHSLEDRIVKTCFRSMASDKEDTAGLGGGLFIDKEPVVDLLTRKPIEASEEEISGNPRSRSAKLRVLEKR